MHFLDRFKVILLDLNGTFMFGQDRFGPAEDFAATYRAIGGMVLSDIEVGRAVRTSYDHMASEEQNPARYDAFPQVTAVLRSLNPTLPTGELNLLEEVIAIHELGYIPNIYANCLRSLATRHRLGLITNIWSRKDRWVDELSRVGILGLLESLVFSSDHKSIKPSPALFNLALMPLEVRKDEVVVIGDSIVCDIEGGKAAGLSTIWINAAASGSAAADYVVSDLLDLE